MRLMLDYAPNLTVAQSQDSPPIVSSHRNTVILPNLNNFINKNILAIAIFFLLPATIANTYVSWVNFSDIGPPPGSWIGMALDLADGVFYRPLISVDGFGGTRQFPLYFVLLALAHEIVPLAPVVIGFLINTIIVLFLMLGMYYFLRRLQTNITMSLLGAVLALSSLSTQWLITSVRGDTLSIALNLWALTLCIPSRNNSRYITPAAILLSLAFASKPTAIYGLPCCALYLFANGEKKHALRICCYALIGYVTIIAGIWAASDGRLFAILHACASGGSTLWSIFKGPSAMLANMRIDDGASLISFLMACSVLTQSSATIHKNPAAILFLILIPTTLFIFSSNGIMYNHLIDIHVASILVVVYWISKGIGLGRKKELQLRCASSSSAAPKMVFSALTRQKITPGLTIFQPLNQAKSMFIVLIALMVVCSTQSILMNMRTASLRHCKTDYAEAIGLIGHRSGPILSDNPAIPATAGIRPYVLDEFMFRILNKKYPIFQKSLSDNINKKYFSAIILSHNISSPEGNLAVSEMFGEGFIDCVLKNYPIRKVAGDSLYVFLYAP